MTDKVTKSLERLSAKEKKWVISPDYQKILSKFNIQHNG